MDSATLPMDDCWNRIGVWSHATERCPRLAEAIHCHNCQVYSQAGQHLLERAPPEGYLTEWSRNLRRDKEAVDAARHSVFVFRLGEEWFGLPTQVLEEVTEIRGIHSLPHNRSNVLRGLVNVRGELHLCVALGFLFQVQPCGDKAQAERAVHERIVVVQHNGERLVFPVSEIRSIHRYCDAELRPAPATVAGASGTFITGVLELDGRQVGCLDAELLFHALRAQLR